MSDAYALTFSLTAPEFSLEQTQAEREALPSDERQALDGALHGLTAIPLKERPTVIENGLRLLHEAIDLLPSESKQDYCRALQVNPTLVQNELDYVAFLRCEQWDAWAAARRVATYWEYRVKVFGEERAFLPMELLSGEGALMADEVEALLCGGFQVLPEDSVGRTLIYVHRQDFFVYPNAGRLVVSLRTNEPWRTAVRETHPSIFRPVSRFTFCTRHQNKNPRNGYVGLLPRGWFRHTHTHASCLQHGYVFLVDGAVRGFVDESKLQDFTVSLSHTQPPHSSTNTRRLTAKTRAC